MKLKFLSTLCLMAMISLTACDQEKETQSSNSGTETKQVKTETKTETHGSDHQDHSKDQKTSEASTKEILIEANDQLKFNLTEFKVKAGTKVKIVFKNAGTMAKNVMGHNVVFLKAGVDPAEFAKKATAAGPDKEYLPGEGTIAASKLLGGGESDTFEFTAPAAGSYDFVCSFPGHWTVMKGKMIVEA